VLTDDNTVLYESLIINEYLDEKYPNPPLMPKDPAKKAKGRILVDYGMAHFDSAYQKLRMELMKEAKEQSQPTIDGAKSDLKKLLQRFEEELGDQEYLLGEFSLVDADLLPRFTRLEGFGVLPDSSLPHLGKYLARVKARPSVKAIL
jgi:glutathione S-transferase